jgi:hypothetical protein
VDEATLREINRVKNEDDQLDESLRLAKQLAEEDAVEKKWFDDLKEANKPFECPICAADDIHEGYTSKAERCDHIVCRDCMINHIKSQIEAAHWPIFCPMCGPDQANRGSEQYSNL